MGPFLVLPGIEVWTNPRVNTFNLCRDWVRSLAPERR